MTVRSADHQRSNVSDAAHKLKSTLAESVLCSNGVVEHFSSEHKVPRHTCRKRMAVVLLIIVEAMVISKSNKISNEY